MYLFFLIGVLSFLVGLIVGMIGMFIRDKEYINEIIEIDMNAMRDIAERDFKQMKRMAKEMERLTIELVRAKYPNIKTADDAKNTSEWIELDFGFTGSDADNIDFPNSKKGDDRNE